MDFLLNLSVNCQLFHTFYCIKIFKNSQSLFLKNTTYIVDLKTLFDILPTFVD